jgi:hypothetical protein
MSEEHNNFNDEFDDEEFDEEGEDEFGDEEDRAKLYLTPILYKLDFSSTKLEDFLFY